MIFFNLNKNEETTEFLIKFVFDKKICTLCSLEIYYV